MNVNVNAYKMFPQLQKSHPERGGTSLDARARINSYEWIVGVIKPPSKYTIIICGYTESVGRSFEGTERGGHNKNRVLRCGSHYGTAEPPHRHSEMAATVVLGCPAAPAAATHRPSVTTHHTAHPDPYTCIYTIVLQQIQQVFKFVFVISANYFNSLKSCLSKLIIYALAKRCQWSVHLSLSK